MHCCVFRWGEEGVVPLCACNCYPRPPAPTTTTRPTPIVDGDDRSTSRSGCPPGEKQALATGGMACPRCLRTPAFTTRVAVLQPVLGTPWPLPPAPCPFTPPLPWPRVPSSPPVHPSPHPSPAPPLLVSPHRGRPCLPWTLSSSPAWPTPSLPSVRQSTLFQRLRYPAS